MSSQKEQLLADVKTDLLAIQAGDSVSGTGSTSHTFVNSIAEVSRDIKSEEMVELPGIIMDPGDSTPDGESTPERIFHTLALDLYGYFEIDSDSDVDTQINALEADIVAAMCCQDNWAHGGLCTGVRFMGRDGDPIIGLTIGAVVCRFELDYSFWWSQP